MAFSPDIKAAAMAACARHCCICHRFRGLKMESHHIVQEADGGPNTFENCIPVCFDCHADMKSYDLKHPRGTKYTPAELVAHRDRWYKKVAEGGGTGPRPEHVAVDKEVFATFQKQVPYSPALDYMKDRNFGYPYERAPLEALFEYGHYGDRAEFEFLDADLEAARAELVAAINAFSSVLATNTWPTHHPGVYSIPEEWEWKAPERLNKVLPQLNDAATRVEQAYKALIRTARVRLGIAGEVPRAGEG